MAPNMNAWLVVLTVLRRYRPTLHRDGENLRPFVNVLTLRALYTCSTRRNSLLGLIAGLAAQMCLIPPTICC